MELLKAIVDNGSRSSHKSEALRVVGRGPGVTSERFLVFGYAVGRLLYCCSGVVRLRVQWG